MTREDVEINWQNHRDGESHGHFLCYYLEYTALEKPFLDSFRPIGKGIIEGTFNGFGGLDPWELGYLLRALTLNMLLDDNEDLLDD